jgi:hypothetical protein
MSQSQTLFQLIRSIDRAFANDGWEPVEGSDEWRELKRHIRRMRCALGLVRTTLRVERELGIPLSDETARKVEGYVRWPLDRIAT